MSGAQIQPPKSSHRRYGFSLIELVVVIGILMILLGLAIPALSRSFAHARATRTTVAVQQAMPLISLYLGQYREVYPFRGPGLSVEASHYFYEPLLEAGLISRKEDIDQDGFRQHGTCNLLMSRCLVFDHAMMRPGRTVPVAEQKAHPVRATEVLYPASKGAIQARMVHDGRVWKWWCCVDPAPPGPVGFCDGSVSIEHSADLREGALYVENEIGFPVNTTWYGVRGRDRQH